MRREVATMYSRTPIIRRLHHHHHQHVRCFGALTSKPYAFTARPWELTRVDTVDVMDGMGSSIQVHHRGGEVLRINPRPNDLINEDWINDKSRYAFDGLKRQRLTRPLVRSTSDPSKWDELHSNWRSAFARISQVLDAKQKSGSCNIRAITGPTVDLYSAVALTDWMDRVGDVQVENIGSVGGPVDADVSSTFRFNSTIYGLEDSDFVLLVGSNIPEESPLLRVRLRKMFMSSKAEIAVLGLPVFLSFPVQQVGLTARSLVEIAEGRHPVCASMAQAKRPSLIVSANVFKRDDGEVLAGAIETIGANCPNMRQYDAEGNKVWDGVNVLHHNANDTGLLELARTVPFDANKPKSDILFLMGTNAQDLPVDIDSLIGDETFVIFQGHHGDELASRADVVLPGAAFSEKSGIYVNFEGRFQKGNRAVTPPADAREDWRIIRALSEVCGSSLPYDSESAIHERLIKLLPASQHRSAIPELKATKTLLGKNFERVATNLLAKGTVDCTPFRPAICDFHLEGNQISRSSQTMAKCSQDEMSEDSNFINFYF